MSNVLKVSLQTTIYNLADRGWSQRRIASELGINRETVRRYLRLAKPAISITGSEEEADRKPAISITGEQTGDTHSKPAISIAGIEAGRRSSADIDRLILQDRDTGGQLLKSECRVALNRRKRQRLPEQISMVKSNFSCH